MDMRGSIGAAIVAAACAATPASADILLDTTPANPAVSYVVGPFLGSNWSLAVPFSSNADTQITSITTYLLLLGEYDVGIMADASGLPSGVFLDSEAVTPGTDPNTITPDWSVSPGTSYWLAVDSASNPTGGDSPQGWYQSAASTGTFAFNSGTGGWSTESAILPAAVISGAGPTSDVPEPLTLSLFGAGFVGLITMRRRKAKKA